MPDEFIIPDISNTEWENLSEEGRQKYNRKIDLKSDFNQAKAGYDTSMSVAGPVLLAIIGGFLLSIFGGFLGVIIGAIPGLLWLIIRVMSRSQAYMRYKDARDALEKAMRE